MLHYEPHSDQQGPCTKPLLSPLTQPQSRNPTPMMHQVRLRTKEGGTRRAVSGNSGASVLEAWDPLAVPFVGMCVCVHMYIYIYIHIHACARTYARTHIHTYGHTCAHLYISARVEIWPAKARRDIVLQATRRPCGRKLSRPTFLSGGKDSSAWVWA